MNQFDGWQDKPKGTKSRTRAILRYLLPLAFPIIFIGLVMIVTPRLPARESGSLFSVLVLILLGVSGLVVTGYLARSFLSDFVDNQKRELQLVRQVVPDLTVPQHPDEMQERPHTGKKSRLYRFVTVLVAAAIVAGVWWLLEQVWPTRPKLLDMVLPLFLVPALSGLGALVREARKKDEPFPWQRLAWGAAVLVVGTLGAMGFLWVFSRVFELIDNTFFALIVVIILGPLFLSALVFLPLFFLPREWVDRPLRRLDYDKALARAAQIERLLKSSTLKGVVLLHAGRHPESEAAIRHSIANHGKSLLLADSARGWLLENLGYVLTEQARYEEAVQAFKAAIEITPVDSDRTSGLAEVYLRQGIERGEALALTARSVKNGKWLSLLDRSMRYSQDELLGNRAWALALDGQREQARETLARALKKIARRSKLRKASLYYRAGQVMRLCGDRWAAREHFEKAIETDPWGNYGGLARRALQKEQHYA